MQPDSSNKLTYEGAAERFLSASKAVEAARAALTFCSLQDTKSCEHLLEEALAHLHGWERLLSMGDAGRRPLLAEAAGSLKRQLAELRAVVDQTISFCSDWAALRGGMESGYTISGLAAAPRRGPRLDLEV